MSILSRINLKSRLYLFTGLSIVLIGGLITMGLIDVYSVRDASKQVYVESFVEVELLHELDNAIERTRIAEFSLLRIENTTEYNSNIERFKKLAEVVDEKILFIADSTNGFDVEVLPLVLQLQGLWKEYREKVTSKFIDTVKPGTFETTKRVATTGQRIMFDKMMVVMDTLVEHEELEASVALATVESRIDSYIKRHIVAAVSIFILLAGILLYISQQMATRIKKIVSLKNGLESVKSGNFNIKVEIDGNDDFSILADDFNLMARQLQEDKVNQEQSAMVLGWYADESTQKATKLVRLNHALTKMQAELVNKNESLNRSIDEVKEMNMQLKETERQMIQSEKMASIGQLSAGVAHEINNPIGFVNSNLSTLNTYIKDFIELINMNRPMYEAIKSGGIDKAKEVLVGIETFIDKSDMQFAVDDVPHLIEESRDGIERVVSIVKGLKDFSHVGTSELTEYDINSCLDGTIKLCWHEIKYKAEVETDFGDIPPVKCHKQKINQIFMNIIINASQAIPERGIIRVVTYAEKGCVVTKISDNGAGMPEAIVRKIFDPFFTTKPVGKGTGLGLSIVYGIVQEHGGSMDVESVEGHGTTFTVKLPVDRHEGLGGEQNIREAG